MLSRPKILSNSGTNSSRASDASASKPIAGSPWARPACGISGVPGCRQMAASKRADSAPAFREASLRRVLLAAAQLRGVGKASAGKSPQKAVRKFLLGLPIPPRWTNEEWELLTLAIRYHRGAEPSVKRGPFSKLSL